jgi:hypothetical protein
VAAGEKLRHLAGQHGAPLLLLSAPMHGQIQIPRQTDLPMVLAAWRQRNRGKARGV